LRLDVRFGIDFSYFGFVWDLVLGIWDFGFDVMADPPPRRWLPRLTLFRFFAWLTLLTLLGSHVATSYRLRQVQRENAELRTRSGEPLTIEQDRLTAGGIALPAEFQWRFRIHKPAGRKLVLKYAVEKIEDEGLVSPHATLGLLYPASNEEGFIVIDAAVVENKGRAVLRIGYGNDSIMNTDEMTLPDQHFFELERQGLKDGATSQIIEDRMNTNSGKLGEPLVLLRVRGVGTLPANVSGQRDGLLIWLEDAP
jgi:hypothetical protein